MSSSTPETAARLNPRVRAPAPVRLSGIAMTEGPPFTVVAASAPAVGLAYAAIVAGAVVSLLAVVIAGVPIAVAIGRTAVERRQWRQVGLLAVPPVTLVIWIGLTVLLWAGWPLAASPSRR